MTVEERIRERLAAGDPRGAATAAIRGFDATVLRYLRSMLRDEDEVADAFSQWAENLWKGMATFEGRSSARTWAIRLACNVAVNQRSRAWRRRERRLASGEASALAEEVRTRSYLSHERRRQRLEELRQDLGAEERTLLFLRVDLELPWEEVAAALSQGGKAVDADGARQRYQRLKAKLKKAARAKKLLK